MIIVMCGSFNRISIRNSFFFLFSFRFFFLLFLVFPLSLFVSSKHLSFFSVHILLHILSLLLSFLSANFYLYYIFHFYLFLVFYLSFPHSQEKRFYYFFFLQSLPLTPRPEFPSSLHNPNLLLSNPPCPLLFPLYSILLPVLSPLHWKRREWGELLSPIFLTTAAAES